MAKIATDIANELGYETRDEFLVAQGYILITDNIGRPKKNFYDDTSQKKIEEERKQDALNKRLAKLCNKLDVIYPDKQIYSLTVKAKSLAATADELAYEMGFSSRGEFLSANGYIVKTFSPNDSSVEHGKTGRPSFDKMAIINELKRRYPNGSEFTSANDLFAANPDLLPRLKTLKNNAKDLFGMPLGKYLKSIGLIGGEASKGTQIEEQKDRIFTGLSEAYPDKLITNLKREHYYWYVASEELARNEGFEKLEDFFSNYGFVYKEKDYEEILKAFVGELRSRLATADHIPSSVDKLISVYSDMDFYQPKKAIKFIYGNSKTLDSYLQEIGVLSQPLEKDQEMLNYIEILKERYKDVKKKPLGLGELASSNRDLPITKLSKFIREVIGEKKAEKYYIRNGILQGKSTDLKEFVYCMVSNLFNGQRSWFILEDNEIHEHDEVIIPGEWGNQQSIGVVESIKKCIGIDAPKAVEYTLKIISKASDEAKMIMAENSRSYQLFEMTDENYKLIPAKLRSISESSKFRTVIKPGYFSPTFMNTEFRGLKNQIDAAIQYLKDIGVSQYDYSKTNTPNVFELSLSNNYDTDIVDQIMMRFPELKMVAFFDEVNAGYVCYSEPGYGYVTANKYISGLEHSQEDLYVYSYSPTDDFDSHVWYHISDYEEKVHYRFPYKKEWDSFNYLIKKADDYYAISEVILPEKIVSLKENAFCNSNTLKRIFLPSTLHYFSAQAFLGTTSLLHIEISEDNKYLSILNGCVISRETGELIFAVYSKNGLALLDNPHIKGIGQKAFSNIAIKEITIPANISYIRDSAFEGCSKLSTIIFKGTTLPMMTSAAFEKCKKLSSIIVPNASIQNLKLVGLEKAIINGFFEMISSNIWNIEENVKNAGHSYIKNHNRLIANHFSDNLQVIYYVTSNFLLSIKIAESMLEKAISAQNAEVISILLDYKNKLVDDKNALAAPFNFLELDDIYTQESTPQETDESSLSGLNIVVTGDLNTFTSREAFKKFIEDHGGKLVGSVSSKTHYLVTNTPNSGTTKNRTAISLGIPVITESQLLEMIEK